jgi:LSD1 subclass zinc finger protein
MAKHRANSAKSVRAVREWLAAYKLKLGCVDCGYNTNAAALQFDHEGPKLAAISELRSSKERILAEIKRGKCKVRCANCHAVKTWERKQPK